MNKVYKYIIMIYSIICIVMVCVCLVQTNPVKHPTKEITLTEEGATLKENDLYKDFSNYELNYMSSNNLINGYQVSRESSYYNYYEKYELVDNELLSRVETKDKFSLETIYFNDSNYLLCRVKLNYMDFVNYDHYIKFKYDRYVNEYMITYDYKETEYGILYLGANINSNLFMIGKLPKYKVSLYKPEVTVSIFIIFDDIEDGQGLYSELLRVNNTSPDSLSIGLNTIKEEPKTAIVEYVGSYLEINRR